MRQEDAGAVSFNLLEARSHLIELAAFFDRVERQGDLRDARCAALVSATQELLKPGATRVRRILEQLSDPTEEPIPSARGKAAAGVWLKS